jgi:probable DNA metabolism protein
MPWLGRCNATCSATPGILRESVSDTGWSTPGKPAGTGIIIDAPFFHRNDSRLTHANRFTPQLWLGSRSHEHGSLRPEVRRTIRRAGGAHVIPTVRIQSFAQWRDAARDLLARQVPPHAVQWSESAQSDDLFGALEQTPLPYNAAADALPAQPAAQSAGAASVPRISRDMLKMLQTAACFRAPDRYAFLYKIVWRWQAGQQDVLSAADEDGARLHAMVKTVQRETHKMNAYLRFRERRAEAGPPQFVAWFEPEHDVLPQVAEHFSRRMGNTTWMIGTPAGTMFWNGASLEAGPALMQGPEDVADSGEAMWLTYYRSIYNPARLNVSVMNGHVASRYWKNMPEGALVPAMIAESSSGARRHGQTTSVGSRAGVTIPVTAENALPQREAPSSLDQCRRCDLWRHATQAVAGVGPRTARIMLVGEQPGDQEDLAGTPFIGPAGKVLDEAFAQAGLARESIYLTNAVKHFKWEPRGKRRLHKTPAQMEISACSYWLEEELAEVQPEVIVALGGTALKAILGDPKATLTDRLGKPFRHEGKWVVVVYHPSYILRVPDAGARAQAMQNLIEGLAEAQQLASGAP